jgi:hypothetical protein
MVTAHWSRGPPTQNKVTIRCSRFPPPAVQRRIAHGSDRRPFLSPPSRTVWGVRQRRDDPRLPGPAGTERGFGGRPVRRWGRSPPHPRAPCGCRRPPNWSAQTTGPSAPSQASPVGVGGPPSRRTPLQVRGLGGPSGHQSSDSGPDRRPSGRLIPRTAAGRHPPRRGTGGRAHTRVFARHLFQHARHQTPPGSATASHWTALGPTMCPFSRKHASLPREPLVRPRRTPEDGPLRPRGPQGFSGTEHTTPSTPPLGSWLALRAVRRR